MSTRIARAATILPVIALVVACFTEPAAADDGDASAPPSPACTPAQQCCKICNTGQACGKTCISRAKVCHKPHACACDAAQVCR